MSNQDFAIQVIRKLPGEASVMDMAQELELSVGIVPRPRVITVGSLPDEVAPTVAERNGGVQSAHRFVPAGAVYHLEADSAGETRKLATALHRHGDPKAADFARTIKNRRRTRRTRRGEPGFDLGICGTRILFC